MKRINLFIFVPTFIISLLGIITLFSAAIGETIPDIIVKQVIFVVLGVLAFLFAYKLDYSILSYKLVVVGIYIGTILLLIATLIFGQEINGAKRWIDIFGVALQPSEIAKLTIIFTTAYIFSLKDRYSEIILIAISFLLTLPFGVLIYLQPHGSMAIICFVIWFIVAFVMLRNQSRNIVALITFTLIFIGMFFLTATGNTLYLLLCLAGIIFGIFAFFARENWRAIIIVSALMALILGTSGSLVWNKILNDYQRNRIVAFIDPQANSQTSGFNVEQARIAIGSGGIFGKGFANGTQSRLNFLPFHETDFIFASYVENFGLVGATFLFALYLSIFITIFKAPLSSPTLEWRNALIIGIGLKMLLEVFINLGTNLGITPATGIPLPLMSAGGTITIITFFSLGVIQGIIASENNKKMYPN